jgi:C4-dicarboxylate-specific signal transduction histidine kinase
MDADPLADLVRIAGNRPGTCSKELQPVTLNLLMNASEAMSGVRDRRRQLVIKTELDADYCVRLRAQEAGMGFQPQDEGRLFEEFCTTK